MGFVWIRAPKTFAVFGILFNEFTRLISGLLPVFTPRSFIYAEAFLFLALDIKQTKLGGETPPLQIIYETKKSSHLLALARTPLHSAGNSTLGAHRSS